MIKVHQITKEFNGIRAVENVSLEINNNSVTSFIGPNGSGKSTLIKLILGLIAPTSGNVEHPSTASSGYKIGYMPEISGLPTGYTGLDILKKHKYLLGYSNDQHIQSLIEIFDMNSFLKKKFKGFSKGMQKKIGFLLAFAGSPDLVILDEPFEGIDTIDRDRLNLFIKEYTTNGRSAILSSHILYDMDEITDQALFLKNGKVMINYNPKLIGSNSKTPINIEQNPSDHGVPNNVILPNPTITDIYRALYK
ncbi:MAG TPA: hypothetical protein DCE78_00945 [Bacteroidetes bacterium]|nr:hypothetical protein [Bacteroidota bacterium]